MQWHKRQAPNPAIDLYVGKCFVGQVWPIDDGRGRRQWLARSEMPVRFDEARYVATFDTKDEAKDDLEAEIRAWLVDAGVREWLKSSR
jgi:hypothetical protein